MKSLELIGSKKLKKLFVASFMIFIFSSIDSFANEPILQATPFLQIKDKIGKEPMMLEFGAKSCFSCITMGKLLYKIKKKYPKSNIFFIDVYKDRSATLRYKIRVIPTQKYLDINGNVVDTHMGVIKQEELEKKLKAMNILK